VLLGLRGLSLGDASGREDQLHGDFGAESLGGEEGETETSPKNPRRYHHGLSGGTAQGLIPNLSGLVFNSHLPGRQFEQHPEAPVAKL
jgi:hypothetical protein